MSKLNTHKSVLQSCKQTDVLQHLSKPYPLMEISKLQCPLNEIVKVTSHQQDQRTQLSWSRSSNNNINPELGSQVARQTAR